MMKTKSKKSDGYNATVESVQIGKEDHGIHTIMVTLDHDDGWTQGFGGLSLNGGKLSKSFESDLAEVFGTKNLKSTVGMRCRMLFCFGGYLNETIEGLETDRGRFTLTGWRKKHFPKTKSVLEQKRERLEDELVRTEARINKIKKEIRDLDKNYTDLEVAQ